MRPPDSNQCPKDELIILAQNLVKNTGVGVPVNRLVGTFFSSYYQSNQNKRSHIDRKANNIK